MKSLLITFVLLAVCLTACANAKETTTPDIFTQNYAEAVALAKETNKSIFIDFTGSDWCYYCIKLDEEVFSKKEFIDFAEKHLVLVKADFPSQKQLPEEIKIQNTALQQRFDITGFPTIVLLNSNEELIDTMVGFDPNSDVATYIAQLKEVLAGDR